LVREEVDIENYSGAIVERTWFVKTSFGPKPSHFIYCKEEGY